MQCTQERMHPHRRKRDAEMLSKGDFIVGRRHVDDWSALQGGCIPTSGDVMPNLVLRSEAETVNDPGTLAGATSHASTSLLPVQTIHGPHDARAFMIRAHERVLPRTHRRHCHLNEPHTCPLAPLPEIW